MTHILCCSDNNMPIYCSILSLDCSDHHIHHTICTQLGRLVQLVKSLTILHLRVDHKTSAHAKLFGKGTLSTPHVSHSVQLLRFLYWLRYHIIFKICIGKYQALPFILKVIYIRYANKKASIASII